MGDISLWWGIIFFDDNTTIIWPQKKCQFHEVLKTKGPRTYTHEYQPPTVQRFWRIGGTMISSPCKTCDRKNQSKEGCYKECELLQAIQKFQLSVKEDLKESGIDHSG